jgi:hypothetical protein
MNTMLKGMLVAVLVVGALAVAVNPAAADDEVNPVQQYREAMWYMNPVIGRWANELDKTVELAAIKPEQVCKTELPALAYRGKGLSEDLRGTNVADASMAETHAQLIGTVEEMTAIAGVACEYPSGAAGALRFERTRLNAQRQAVLSWLLSGIQVVETPARPGAGN